jgi:hypothetical protein
MIKPQTFQIGFGVNCHLPAGLEIFRVRAECAGGPPTGAMRPFVQFFVGCGL